MLLDRFSFIIATRYSRPRPGQGAAGILSFVSLLGIALAVFSLVVVTSVMNGFERELQNRMLTLVPHLQFELNNSSQSTLNEQLVALKALTGKLQQRKEIDTAVPYISDFGIINQRSQVIATDLLGIDPVLELEMSALDEYLIAGRLESLAPGEFGIIIGSGLARKLGVYIDDSIDITVPRIYISPLGVTTRQKRFQVTGIFEVGSELDMSQILVNIEDARKLLGRKHYADGIRLALKDPHGSHKVAGDILNSTSMATSLDGGVQPVSLSTQWRDWRQLNAELFSAVAMEKTMMFVLLLAVVGVACFNVISIVLMTANDKKSDIAVLRTIGASRASIRNVFILQGIIIGTLGSLVGAVAGVIVAPQIGKIVSAMERALGMTLFDPDVYYIPYLPSVLRWGDVALVTLAAIIISVSVAVLPAIRAASINPVLSLRASV